MSTIKRNKQNAYNKLINKRRSFIIDKEHECENTANFPYENNPFDKIHHIDFLTAWTEDWEICKDEEGSFKYLKNLDADIVIIGKDSTGKNQHLRDTEECKNLDKNLIADYINKTIDNIDIQLTEKQKTILETFRFGFSPEGVKTIKNLRTYCEYYLKEKISDDNEKKIIPKKNKNIFMINGFVFLSAEEKTHSKIPNKLFKTSIKEFIIPLLQIIKPKIVIQLGSDVIGNLNDEMVEKIESSSELKEINLEFRNKRKELNFDNQKKYLTEIHEKMDKNSKNIDEIFLQINWDTNNKTYFIPSFHPSYVMRYKNDLTNHTELLIWEKILTIKEFLINKND